MKRGHIIIGAILLITMIWRAPVVGVDPRTGALNIPDIRYMFENALVWSALAAFCFFIATRVNIWMGLFLLLVSFSAWYPVNSGESEKAHMMVLYGIIWYFLCVQYLNTDEGKIRILNVICVIALVNTLMLFMQGFINFDPIHQSIAPAWGADSDWDRVPNVGLMDCQNSASALLAFSAPAFCRKRWLWGLIPLSIGLILCRTFAGPLALSAAAVLFGLFYAKTAKHRLAILLVCLVFLFGYYRFVDKPDTSWRLKTWKIGIDLYKQHWILGSGIGHWKAVFGTEEVSQVITGYTGRQKEIMAQAHNEPLQLLFETGIFSGVLMIGFLLSVIRRYKKEAILPTAALVIILVDSLVFFPFHIALLGMVAMTWLAILENSLKPSRFLSSSG